MQARPTLQRVWPTLAALLIMLLASMAYFSPQLQGKVIGSGDTLANVAMGAEVRAYGRETGRQSLWTNSMFGGMPTYQITGPERGNVLRYVERALHLGFERPISYFFMLMAGMFLLLRVLGVPLWLSCLLSIAFGLGTNHMVLFEAGHMTKIRAISFMAPVLAGLIVLFRGRYLGGAAIFASALGLQVYANHPQMTYYFAAACGAFVLFRLIRDIEEGQLPRFATALAVSLLCAGLAIGANFAKISTTLEYAEETIRGRAVLSQPVSMGGGDPEVPAGEGSGLAWERAMAWSNGPLDVLAGYVYGVAGGSSAEPVERDGPVGTTLRRAGQQVPPTLDLPLYHGTMPFTSGPVYYGAVGVFLFVLAMFFLPAGWRYFFGGAVLLTLLLSMGKNAAWLNRFFFDTLPLFNNFRAPASATSVTAVLVSAGGAAGLWYGLRQNAGADAAEAASARTSLLARFYLGAGVGLGILLVFALLGPSLVSLSSDGDARLAQAGFPLDALIDERAALLRSSAWRSLGFALLSAGAIWAYLRGVLSATPALAIVGVLAVFDVWGVSQRYLGKGDFAVPARANASLDPRPVDEQILQDPDPHYRVHDVTVDVFNDAAPAKFHHIVGGYHAAKLRRYQDLIDRYIAAGSMPVLNMLNTRYIITGQRGAEQVQRNPAALGNAWFVSDVREVATPDDELAALEQVDLANTAIVHEEWLDALSTRRFTGQGEIALTSYAPDRLTYRSNSDLPQLAVFSEVWYGPDKGWYATIDGQPADLLRANYALRALELPAGEHEVVMYFAPETFRRGETISYASSIAICLLGIAAAFFGVTGRRPPGEPTESADALETIR